MISRCATVLSCIGTPLCLLILNCVAYQIIIFTSSPETYPLHHFTLNLYRFSALLRSLEDDHLCD